MASSSSSLSKIELIPWDFESSEHQQRVYQQRGTCGWRSEEVHLWVDSSRKGEKTLYWIVIADGVSDREAHIAESIAKYPQESTPLVDTASQLWLQPRTPSRQSFHPIGHIALDKRPEEDAHLGLPKEGVVWIAGLYISWALQSGGYGGAAMREAERVAAAAPLDGQLVVLDTMAEEMQLSTRFLNGAPAPKISNEAWYRKQGYAEFKRAPGYRWLDPTTGEREALPVVFFKKRLC